MCWIATFFLLLSILQCTCGDTDSSTLKCSFDSQHLSRHKAMTRLQDINLQYRIYSANDEQGEYSFHFGICVNPLKETSKDPNFLYAGVIQENIITKAQVVIGRFNNSSIMGGTDWIRLDYLSGKKYRNHCTQSDRVAYVMMICDPADAKGTFVVIEENTNRTNGCYYLFELHIASLCFSSGSAETIKDNSMSIGDLLLILFFTSILMYLMVGSLFNLVIQRKCSRNILPHRDSWRLLSNLVADGCNFVFRTAPSTATGTTAYQQPPINTPNRLQLDSDSEIDEYMLPM